MWTTTCLEHEPVAVPTHPHFCAGSYRSVTNCHDRFSTGQNDLPDDLVTRILYRRRGERGQLVTEPGQEFGERGTQRARVSIGAFQREADAARERSAHEALGSPLRGRT